HTRFSRDWSSDVCSSDLLRKTYLIRLVLGIAPIHHHCVFQFATGSKYRLNSQLQHLHILVFQPFIEKLAWNLYSKNGSVYSNWRSEERRVGKERRSRW